MHHIIWLILLLVVLVLLSKVQPFSNYCPDVRTSFKTVSNPTREASVRIIICGFN